MRDDGCVVCLGACAMDLMITVPTFPAPDEMAFVTGEPCLLPGGSTANIATGVARLGIPCRFVGKVGDDPNGRALRSAFEADGVDTRWLTVDKSGRTAQTIIAVDGSGSRIIYSLGGTALIESDEGFTEDILRHAAVLYVGEAFPDVAAKAMTMARNKGVLTVFGPGGSISWLRQETVMGLMAEADYVILSRSELRAVSGCDSPDDGARELMSRGIRSVVTTLGEMGSACYCQGCEEASAQAPRFDVEVVDTTGAGDAFASGFMCALVKGYTISQCLLRGNASAAIAIGAVGAREALPTHDQVEVFIEAHSDQAVKRDE